MKLNFFTKMHSKMPTLETDRLIFRAINQGDVEDMFEYSSDPKTSQFLLWDVHKSQRHTEEIVNIILSKYRSGEYNDWALVLKQNHKMIGTCGFTKIDAENSLVEIGYVLNPKYWGMGLATEAVRRIIEFSFETLRVNRVESKFIFGNNASLAVMNKVGMKFEGYNREAMLVKGKYRTIGVSTILLREYLIGKK